MSIQSSQLQLASSRTFVQTNEVRETLIMERREPGVRAATTAETDPVSLSSPGRALAQEALETVSTQSVGAATESKASIEYKSLLEALIEYLTGKSINKLDLRAEGDAGGEGDGNESPVPASATAATGGSEASSTLTYERVHRYEEHEATRFQASGIINTTDGQSIRFSINLEMSRSYVEESSEFFQVTTGGQRQDPLVINYSGKAASLLDQRFAFDLLADGEEKDIPVLAPGSGYLVFDRNQDGRVNDGAELFGTISGNAYADLKALDADGNEWIDGGDAAFKHLALWIPGGEGKG
ncbi:MAG: hypothetical protein M0Q54_06815, partial [Pigmentiphaga sp.]|nr:hypothetical protein [Pigmentiphaga sp.]